MTDHSEAEWIKYRKILLFNIGETSRAIRELYGSIRITLNGDLKKLDVTNPDFSSQFSEKIDNEFNRIGPIRTGYALNLTHVSADLAQRASVDVDRSIFGSEIGIRLGGGDNDVAARLSRKRFKSGFALSDSVWSSDKKLKKQFTQTIENGIKQGDALTKTVKKLVEIKRRDAPENLPKYLQQIDAAARRAAAGMPGAHKQFRRLSASIRQRLALRKVAEYARPVNSSLSILGTRQATEAFIDRVEKAVAKNSSAMVGEAVDKYLVKRAEYHATRAARTMAGRAFMESGQVERKKKKWVIGEKWNLSGSHPRFDECDVRSSIDLGQGPGVYPPGGAPFDHVNGLCFLSDVIDEQYFERDEPLKPKWKKNRKKLIDAVRPGSDVSKLANRLGAQENRGKIAEEVRQAGIYFQPPGGRLTPPKTEPIDRATIEKRIATELEKVSTQPSAAKKTPTAPVIKPKPTAPVIKPKQVRPVTPPSKPVEPVTPVIAQPLPPKPVEPKPIPSTKPEPMVPEAYTSYDSDLDTAKTKIDFDYLGWKKSLTVNEIRSLRAYKGDEYIDFNRLLRNPGLFEGKEISKLNDRDIWRRNKIREKMELVDSAIEKSDIPENLVVYRGVAIDNMSDDSAIGTEFLDKGYASTSLSKSTARNFGQHRFYQEIRLPKGAKGAWLEYFPIGGNPEYEILLPHGMQYRVIDDVIDEEGIRKWVLEPIFQ